MEELPQVMLGVEWLVDPRYMGERQNRLLVGIYLLLGHSSFVMSVTIILRS
jgi:high-affinity nickel permease